MMISIRIAAVCVLLTASATAADPVKWGDGTAGWEVFVDPELGHACYIQKDFDDGLRVQFGLRPLQNGAFFAAYRTDWDQLEAAWAGTLFIRFGQDTFGGDAEVRTDGDWRGVYAFFNNPEMAEEMARKRDMAIHSENTEETIIDLAGTSLSFKKIRTCQDEQPAPE